MLFHRRALLVVGITLLTTGATFSQTEKTDRLALPSETSRSTRSTQSKSDADKYTFKESVVDEYSDLPPTYYQAKGSALFGTHSHRFQVENHAMVPLLRADDLDGTLFIYEHRDYVPFTEDNGGSQVESITNFDNLRLDYSLTDDYALKAIAGYATRSLVDRMGAVGGYKAGIGIGSPYEALMEDLTWEVMVGGLVRSEGIQSNWFLDTEVSWRVIQFDAGTTGSKEFKPAILLELSQQSTNKDAHFHYYVEAGPTIEIQTVNNNRFSFFAHYFKNSHNEFHMHPTDRGVMAGIKGTVFHDKPQPMSYDWDMEGSRWIPRLFGETEVGGSPDGFIRKMRFNLDAWEFGFAGQIATIYTNYEHRQDQIGAFSSTSFSVAPGVKTYFSPEDVGIVTDDQHLVLFGQYFHRSDHAVNLKDINRLQPTVTNDGYLDRLSVDNLEAGFQTLGWDNPNYRTDKFLDDTKFVNEWDWMIKAGYAINEERSRSQPPASLGINWDIASLHGFVFYAQGIVSTGEASPDYLAELGLKRPGGSLFIRLENYGLPARLEDLNKPVYVGMGLNL